MAVLALLVRNIFVTHRFDGYASSNHTLTSHPPTKLSTYKLNNL